MSQGQQLRLELFETGQDTLEPLDWVLGHYGSPQEGLRAVRLQAPSDERTSDGAIARWLSVVDLYDASTGAALPLVGATEPRPAPVPIAEPELTLRPHPQPGAAPAPA